MTIKKVANSYAIGMEMNRKCHNLNKFNPVLSTICIVIHVTVMILWVRHLIISEHRKGLYTSRCYKWL